MSFVWSVVWRTSLQYKQELGSPMCRTARCISPLPALGTGVLPTNAEVGNPGWPRPTCPQAGYRQDDRECIASRGAELQAYASGPHHTSVLSSMGNRGNEEPGEAETLITPAIFITTTTVLFIGLDRLVAFFFLSGRTCAALYFHPTGPPDGTRQSRRFGELCTIQYVPHTAKGFSKPHPRTGLTGQDGR